MKTRSLIVFVLGLLFFATSARGADWPQFRGPGGLGIAPDTGLPASWTASSNVAWKTELPGPGSSSPIVAGSKIFVTCYSGYGDQKGEGDVKDLKRHLVCLDRGGKILWKRTIDAAQPEYPFKGFTALHGYASSTPASDGKNVYVFFGKSGVFAFDLEGKQLWKASAGSGTHTWGSGTSPVLYKNLVIINAAVESGSLIALNKSDGSVAWSDKGLRSSWNTPLLVKVIGRHELVVNSYGQVRAYDPDKGTELWTCEGMDDYVCPSAVAHGGVVFVIGARSNTAVGIRAGGKGDVTSTHLLWTLKKGSNVSSPVYHDGHIYWASERLGTVYCASADKGTLVYEEKLAPVSDRIYASPIVADGKIYYVSRNNGVYVLAAGPKFKLLAHNSLADPSVFNGSPALSDGQLLLRSNRYLYCLGRK